MEKPPDVPPLLTPQRVITYNLTRWDLVVNSVTLLLRNRVIQVMVPVFLILNGALIVGPGAADRPLSHTVISAVVFAVAFIGLILLVLLLLGLATAFLFKQRGVVGRHVLEITDRGLIERTDYNETVHRWDSVCRIMNSCGYLFIYVSDMNSHQVPKCCFSPSEIAAFETDLRAHATQARSW